MICPAGWGKAIREVLWEEFVELVCFWRKK